LFGEEQFSYIKETAVQKTRDSRCLSKKYARHRRHHDNGIGKHEHQL